MAMTLEGGAWERIALSVDGRARRAERIAIGTRWIGYTSPDPIRVERITEPRRYADDQASPGRPPR